MGKKLNSLLQLCIPMAYSCVEVDCEVVILSCSHITVIFFFYIFKGGTTCLNLLV